MLNKLLYFSILVVCLSCNSNNNAVENNKAIKQDKNVKVAEKSNEEIENKSILFFGDSLTAGFGLGEEEAYPALIQNKLDSLSMPYEVINAGISGETSADGLNRIDWVLNQKVDVFVLALGANDMLRGLNLNLTKNNLDQIIARVKAKYPGIPILVLGMYAPSNMGEKYVKKFAQTFKEVSTENKTSFLPFLLEGVAGVQSLNLPDGKHPNAEGQKLVADNVWDQLYPLLK